jgi:putative PEP-CTERM system histidine kinase
VYDAGKLSVKFRHGSRLKRVSYRTDEDLIFGIVSPNSMLALAAGSFSAALAMAAACRKRRSLATWCFSAGMLTFGLESLFGALWHDALLPEKAAFWGTLTLVAKSFLPGFWLCFSLTYSRGKSRELPASSRFLILAAVLVPVGVSLIFLDQLAPILPHSASGGNWWISTHAAAKTLNGSLLIAAVLVLVNLERTFRSAVGTMQWRIKFMVLGLAIIFGARIYTQSQALLFSGDIVALSDIDAAALLIGCALISVAFLRSGFGEIDVYVSNAVLRTSLTVLLTGAYLFIVGVLAQVAARTGGPIAFQVQAFVVLLGFALLAVLLLSNRIRQNIRSFVSRHFRRPQYDFRQIWARFAQCTSSVLDQTGLCTATAKLISETFNVLSVTIWLFDEHDRLTFAASTSKSEREANHVIPNLANLGPALAKIRGFSKPFDLEKAKGDYAESLRQIGSSHFRAGGNRICAPLWTGDRCLGVAILADRVGGVPYTVEELDLLKCMGDQIAVSILNLWLTEEIMRGKELEAFQTISAFFVHDLKNAASTLSLTLQNLPVHFDDPVFRQDALRGIGEATNRINQLISRLGAMRPLEPKLAEVDLDLLVADSLEALKSEPGITVVKNLHLQRKLSVDRDQFGSVVTNLLLNARDAIHPGGEIRVETGQSNGWAILSVADNGCGISPAFLRGSLFRPFQTTKKKGLGIGMFQSKMIVEAHRGKIQVDSEPGAGTTIRVMLPLNRQGA